MTADDSITIWIARVKETDREAAEAAAQALWERYYARLVRLARARLAESPRRVVDEEDVALSVLDSFCRGAAEGRFPQLSDRENLWPLLVAMTAHKVVDARRRETRQKRGGGDVRGESVFVSPGGGDADREIGIEQVIGVEPTPEFAAEVADETRRWLDALGSEELRSVALWKMEGDTNAEIAAKLGVGAKTVERRLKLIRLLLEKEAAS
jgi:DNA-directed RNA polymerase specialized sigma24 family protein